MSSERPLKPRERLLASAEAWSHATGRSLGALSSIVSNHGSTLERLKNPATGVNDITLEKFARFLVDASNWPEGVEVPAEVIAFGHAVGVSPPCPAPATGQTGELSGRERAA